MVTQTHKYARTTMLSISQVVMTTTIIITDITHVGAGC
ncbi:MULTISPECIES: thr operon leader peptide [Vibrio]